MISSSDDYPYIRAWGVMLGSSRDYIDTQVAQARADGVPANAIHKNTDGYWSSTDDITSPDTRHYLGLPPLPPLPPRDSDPAEILAELAELVRGSSRLRDVYGLTGCRVSDGHALRLEFSTGAALALRLSPVDHT